VFTSYRREVEKKLQKFRSVLFEKKTIDILKGAVIAERLLGKD